MAEGRDDRRAQRMREVRVLDLLLQRGGSEVANSREQRWERERATLERGRCKRRGRVQRETLLEIRMLIARGVRAQREKKGIGKKDSGWELRTEGTERALVARLVPGACKLKYASCRLSYDLSSRNP
jgi:hypothetical protein